MSKIRFQSTTMKQRPKYVLNLPTQQQQQDFRHIYIYIYDINLHRQKLGNQKLKKMLMNLQTGPIHRSDWGM